MTEYREFDKLEDVTPDDVEWLKKGAVQRGEYIVNEHHIRYTTKRGIRKSMTYFGGRRPWRSVSSSGTVYDHLSTEEARVFDPEVAVKRDSRKGKKEAKPENAIAVKVGDVFCGCFGYEACLYDFHEVVKVSASGKTCWTRRLKEERRSTSYDEWKCRPRLHEYEGEEERHTIQYSGVEPYIRLTSYMTANIMEDVSEWYSGYNYH